MRSTGSTARTTTSSAHDIEAGADPAADLVAFGLLGRSPAFLAVVERVRRYAATSAHVLVQGETGTGKELVARAIHYLGARRYKPFVPVNCGALPDTLIESELFGHLRGAFTDARESRPGLIAGADGGTLFLDEIECLSHKGQVALLRFLQDGRYRPLGARADVGADVRVIAASNQDFALMVRTGRFREDLLYRLAIMPLALPPLRERGDDVLLLAQHFVKRFARQYGRPGARLDADAVGRALAHRWPGNIRELENLIHRQFLLADDGVLRLDPPGGEGCTPGRPRGSGRSDAAEDRSAHPEGGRRPDHDGHGDALDPAEDVLPRCAAPSGGGTHPPALPMRAAKAEAIARFEREYLERVIAESRGNVSRAAQHAGKERRAFGKLLKKYGIDRSRYWPG